MSFETVERALRSDVPRSVRPRPDVLMASGADLRNRSSSRHEVDRIRHVEPVGSGLLQRACACGGTPGPDGMCAECRAKHELAASGIPAEASEDLEIHLSESPGETVTAGAGGAEPASTACPTDIKVAEIIPVPVTAAQIGKGIRSGWGAITRMEVSGGGKTWDGTVVKEVLSAGTNDCDNKPACANTSGQGGNAGSTWKIGQASPAAKTTALGEVVPAKPATKNSFWDLHIQGDSVDWCGTNGSCSRSCTQHYECGGKQFGPEFTVSWSFSSASRKDPDDKTVSICAGTLRKEVAAAAK